MTQPIQGFGTSTLTRFLIEEQRRLNAEGQHPTGSFTALLNDVRSFVRRGVEIRLALETGLAAACVGLGTERVAGFGGGTTRARLDAGDIVSRTKRSLDRLAVGQRLCRSLCSAGGDVAGR